MRANRPTDPAPAGIRPGTRYFPELESLRGVAILLVVVFHADGALLFPFRNRQGTWPNPVEAFVLSGHTGVTLFFVLSAFLLSLPFLRAAYGGPSVSRADFYRRRALRILPLYWTAVVVAAVVTAASPAEVLRGVPYLAFLESCGSWVRPMPPWSGVWWSLATEVQFYAVLPLIALGFGRSGRATLGLLALWAAAFVLLAAPWLPLEPFFRAQSFAGRSPVFLAGIGAAWVWQRHGETVRAWCARHRWLGAGGSDLLLLVVLGVLGTLLRWATFHGFLSLESSTWFVWHVPEGVLWAAVVLIVLLLPLRAKALLSNPVLGWLGVVSYSIYVLHQPVIHYTLRLWRRARPGAEVGWAGADACWFVAAMALCLVVATVTHHAVERPFLVRKARVGRAATAAREAA